MAAPGIVVMGHSGSCSSGPTVVYVTWMLLTQKTQTKQNTCVAFHRVEVKSLLLEFSCDSFGEMLIVVPVIVIVVVIVILFFFLRQGLYTILVALELTI